MNTNNDGSTDVIDQNVTGKFIQLEGERFYVIENYDQMPNFFISLVSSDDHWLFISSSGCLTAGRVKPEFALFPYRSVDYIHESAHTTGSRTLVRVHREKGKDAQWQPFNTEQDGLYTLSRHLYRNTAGDKIVFEETNHDLNLRFRYQWATSEQYGFIRSSVLDNLGEASIRYELLDGLQNVLPAGAPHEAMKDRSALVDAYKWNERSGNSSLATYSMYAKLSDRAEPAESLLATSIFATISDYQNILLSSQQVRAFAKGADIENETLCKGVRGAYLLNLKGELSANQTRTWQIVADIRKTQAEILQLEQQLQDVDSLKAAISESIAQNQRDLIGFMASTDALQTTNDELTTVHHYANVLFNNLRGGVSLEQYTVDKTDFIRTLTVCNAPLVTKHQALLNDLPEKLDYNQLKALVQESADSQLIRLCSEYLPLTFGRRHGDPSRPWNHFEIKVKEQDSSRILSYQGNWRDIFQNWEALAVSYPSFIESFIAKFVNASTIDGYNPYRVTKEGIDWELLDAEDPWSNIGYWGDHQIIYLLKFLELSKQYHPQELTQSLTKPVFAYANVPYEIKDFDALLSDGKNTVNFNQTKQDNIYQREAELGSDGRLLLDSKGDVYLVSLTEKLLVPLLSKMSNFVFGGGIWLNTQRPEWNDANNAIVGNGLSMVTLYYIRRYLSFMQKLYVDQQQQYVISSEVVTWLERTTDILMAATEQLETQFAPDQFRTDLLAQLGHVGAEYRNAVYQQEGFSGTQSVSGEQLNRLFNACLSVVDQTITLNQRDDKLYNAYNIADFSQPLVTVSELYPMLEGQVSVLSSGLLNGDQAADLIDNLFASEMYREDQHSFMLYPDRNLASFMDKNHLSASKVESINLLVQTINNNDRRLVEQDIQGNYHFSAQFENANMLRDELEAVKVDYAEATELDRQKILDLYEATFNHQAFTGRSGTMFGYEGLGCIYWHMVSKLLLATQENYIAERDAHGNTTAAQRLAKHYYRVREGIGFNKTPLEYGAFPTDPYSHTPKQAGAQQPGMTGQVKEEILTRFVELGVEIQNGLIQINPSLLRKSEFVTAPTEFEYALPSGQFNLIGLEPGQLGFTYCQTPFIYTQQADQPSRIVLHMVSGDQLECDNLQLSVEVSESIFERRFEIAYIEVLIESSLLLEDELIA